MAVMALYGGGGDAWWCWSCPNLNPLKIQWRREEKRRSCGGVQGGDVVVPKLVFCATVRCSGA